ncbi:MAG: FAD-dependent oxidoreductase [Bacteroidetes bacterium HGW-Bacteroidetes-17]|nr:MAG: FAD-dependent oxidoreductase [Bacteroidetes bacterium HGW-Bacteroidetes-17]
MITIPRIDKKRIVIVGCGFAGLKLARKLHNSNFQVIIIDKNNFHQFQPLFYQVASAGLEPSAISFPLRKIFQHYKDFYLRKANVIRINTDKNELVSSIGILQYDILVLAHGAKTSFFGMDRLEHCAKSMKSVVEALEIRNSILQNFEDALSAPSPEERNQYMNIVVVGGGPSGVEISGALAEMRNYILPKDFPELDCSKINIYLIEGNNRLLGTMSERTSEKAAEFLKKLGIKVLTSTVVKDCDEKYVFINTSDKIRSNIVIWTAGVKANRIEGLNSNCYSKSERLLVDNYNRITGYDNIFAIGDVALMKEENYPNGHPQLAQVAIQQASLLAKNLKNSIKNKPLKIFHYHDLGTMATIGRNLAVVELPYIKFQGLFAWFVWMFIHLFAIVGVKNKMLIFINWVWNYFTYDQSLRLIIKPKDHN